MGGPGKRALLLAVVAFALTSCGLTKKPYAHDPLLRDGGGIWGNPAVARQPDYSHYREPLAPHAPKPANLPTLEWEAAGAEASFPAQ